MRQRYGTAVTAEVLEESVNRATQQVLSERGLRPAVQPKIDLISKDLGIGIAADLEFKIELELLPDIEMPDFAAIALTRLKAEVADETVDKTLADIAARNRGYEDIPLDELGDRGAAKGEVLIGRLYRQDRRRGIPGRHRQRRARSRWAARGSSPASPTSSKGCGRARRAPSR